MKNISVFIIIIIAATLSCPCIAQEDTHNDAQEKPAVTDFTKFSWGMSKDELMKDNGKTAVTILTEAECLQQKNCFEAMTYPKGLNSGLKVQIDYYFRDDGLMMVNIESTVEHKSAFTSMIDYDLMFDNLSVLRGSPKINIAAWINKKGGEIMPGNIENGDAYKFAEWDDKDSLINLYAISTDGKIKVFMEFFEMTPESIVSKNVCRAGTWYSILQTCRPSLLLPQ